jgi:hypothetical protein
MAEDDVVAMPLSLDELLVLMRSLKTAQESEHTKTADKEVISRITNRIARFAERQGAYWDKPSSQA